MTSAPREGVPTTWDIHGLQAAGYDGFVPLLSTTLPSVPQQPGTYVVVRPGNQPPVFLEQRRATRPGQGAPYSPAGLRRDWDALGTQPVVYIGKATNLKTRITQYRRSGLGQATTHEGGRALWWLADADQLLIAWRPLTPTQQQVALADPAARHEDELLAAFIDAHGSMPWANTTAPRIAGYGSHQRIRQATAAPGTETAPRPLTGRSIPRHPIVLPSTLTTHSDGPAIATLRAYYAPLTGRDTGFTGGAWDTFDPSGTREQDRDRFTSDDLTACALLSAPISGRAAIELLDRQADTFTRLLEPIPHDIQFTDLPSLHTPEFTAVRDLYIALRRLPGIGRTRATKLAARKRPHLIPIIDDLVASAVFPDLPTQWEPLHDALRADDHALQHRLDHLRDRAGLDHDVSTLRIFDVLAWMGAAGHGGVR